MKPPLRVLLDAYGIEYRDGYGWTKANCFNPEHDDRVASASVNLDEGVFHCFACGVKGDAYSLIMMMEGCDFATAAERAKEFAGGGDEPVREGPFTGRRLPAGKGYKPRYRNSLPARLRPFTGKGA